MSKKVVSICPRCHKEFSYYASAYKRSGGVKTYCSRRCYSQSTHIWTTCPQCGKEFWYHRSWPRKYCSRECSAAVNAKSNLGIIELPPMFCEECSKEITGKKCRKSRFCSLQCFGKWQSKHIVGSKHPLYKGGYEPYYYGPNWLQQRRNARHRDNYTCQRCGDTENELERQLDVHHIIPFREFGIERYKEANKVSNLISLCNVCHKTVEHNGL